MIQSLSRRRQWLLVLLLVAGSMPWPSRHLIRAQGQRLPSPPFSSVSPTPSGKSKQQMMQQQAPPRSPSPSAPPPPLTPNAAAFKEYGSFYYSYDNTSYQPSPPPSSGADAPQFRAGTATKLSSSTVSSLYGFTGELWSAKGRLQDYSYAGKSPTHDGVMAMQ